MDYAGPFAALVVIMVIGGWLLWRLVIRSIYVVRHSEVMIIERFGRFKCILRPGVHWVWPIIESPRVVNWRYLDASFDASSSHIVSITTDRIDMREHVIDLGDQTVITRDTVQLELDALVYFRITDPQRAVYQIQNLPDSVELLTQSTLRNIIAGLTLDDTFSSREEINAELLVKVQRDCERWGVAITRVEVFNISPPHDILEAMTKQITAERERRSNVLTADGERESSIIESRGKAAQYVLQAEGTRAASILRAKGAAEARKVMSAAEATCLSDVRAAVAPYSVKGVEYLATVEYLNTLAQLTTGRSERVVMVPAEAMDVMNTVMQMATGVSGLPVPSDGGAGVGGGAAAPTTRRVA
jgi:regulator of protease activity HflC (stomatin/prohibitin superfamily)